MATKKEAVKDENEEITDAKGGQLAVREGGAVATPVRVEGVALKSPFIRVGQGMSQWRSEGRAPVQGAFYIGKDKQTNYMVGEPGADKGLDAILLDVIPGIMEDKKYTGASNPPQRFVGPDALEGAKKAGFDPDVLKDSGEVWPDSKKPIMRANASRFCYLQVLIPVPEDFNAMEFQLFPIGDRLYTPGRIEFSKGAFRELCGQDGKGGIIGNMERTEKFRHRHDKDPYEFTWRGKLVHVFTVERTSKMAGNPYPFLSFGLAVKNGKPAEFSEQERQDFVQFLSSITSVEVDSTETDDPEL